MKTSRLPSEGLGEASASRGERSQARMLASVEGAAVHKNPAMRWHVMVHSVLSFFYNAVVLAAAIGFLTGK